MQQEIERRFQRRSSEAAKATGRIISGYCARFDLPTKIGGRKDGFIEVVRRGAFSRPIRQNQDVRCLINHDPNHIVGRTANGTLALQEDDKGLQFRCNVAQTRSGDDLISLINDQTLSGCSFSFAAVRDKWSSTVDGSTGRRCDLRELLDVDLFDTSIVTYPAYGGTSAVRDLDDDEDDDEDDPLLTLAATANSSRSMPVELRSRITRVIESHLLMTLEERRVYTAALLLETKADR